MKVIAIVIVLACVASWAEAQSFKSKSYKFVCPDGKDFNGILVGPEPRKAGEKGAVVVGCCSTGKKMVQILGLTVCCNKGQTARCRGSSCTCDNKTAERGTIPVYTLTGSEQRNDARPEEVEEGIVEEI